MKLYPERITFKQGEDFGLDLTVMRDRNLVNLTGYTIEGAIFRQIPTYAVVEEFDIKILNQSEYPGKFSISLLPEQTSKIKHRDVYIADFSIISPDGSVFKTSNIFVHIIMSPEFALNKDNSEQTTDDEENNAENEP